MSDAVSTTAAGADIVGNLTNLTDIEKAFEAAGLAVLDFASLTGDGWGDVVEKDTLLGQPFLIADVKFHTGDFGDYAAVLAVKLDGTRVVFTDGSSGIYKQLIRLEEQTGGRLSGIACRSGLRKSEYEKDGRAARTYYIAG